MSEARPNGFFTLGVPPERYRLPHPRLGLPLILLVRRVLCRAFEKLREGPFPLAGAHEDKVTAALRAVIENDLRETGSIPGFSRRTYEPVVRQGQVANFDGTRLAKSPDLRFQLRHGDEDPRTVLAEYDALFVECKPVDNAHSAGHCYCDDGLVRFVRGDYAWAMQEGMMLAYVRHGRTIAAHLVPAMQGTERMTSLATIELPRACRTLVDARSEPIHVSKHRREFAWPDRKGKACNITIYHLWHDCN
jgi:hypothetical protein